MEKIVKTFRSFYSRKIIVGNLASLELFLMLFSKYAISKSWKLLNEEKLIKNLLTLGSREEDI